MNIAEYSIQKRYVTWFFTVFLIIGGVFAYKGLGKLEDPAFTIKTAVVTTAYPGATPKEVEEEVTEVIERAAQQMGQVDKVRSLSQEGVSLVYVDIKDTYTAKDLPQIWDELRRKINDVQEHLPPGTSRSLVNDDYGDVYGVYFALTGEGYSYRELEDFADYLRRELLLVPGVASVEVTGIQKEAIYVEISRTKLSQLGISMGELFQVLKAQNFVVPSGKVRAGAEYIRITPTGEFSSVEQVGALLLASSSRVLIRLDDIATVTRNYIEPTRAIMRYNGSPAVGIGISNVEGGNVIAMGEAIKKRLKELEPQTPIGMNLGLIYYQSDTVQKAINNFLLNLLEALSIVIAILLIFMGFRSGMLIGGVLLLTIFATFIAMKLVRIDLHSISLGALIVALGMLVDNAIVVADGLLVRIQSGEDRISSAVGVVTQTQWPLLGATFIAVIAFAPIGLSPDSTGEFCQSLFQVVGISLIISWVLAVTVTPVAGVRFLKTSAKAEIPYDTKLYRVYRRFLKACIRKRKVTILVMVCLLGSALIGFTFVDQSFFPSSSSPLFTVEFWRPRGAYIEETQREVEKVEAFILKQPETVSVTSYVGQGALRFILTYTPSDSSDSYGHLIVEAKDLKSAESLRRKLGNFMNIEMPDIDPRVRSFSKGTGGGAKIQARFTGDDPRVLRRLGEEAFYMMRNAPDSMNIRSDWGERVKVIRPVLDEVRTRQAGLTRQDVASALEMSFSGIQAGLYRERDKLLPIIARLPKADRARLGALPEVEVWSPLMRKYIALTQITKSIDTIAEDPVIYRRNRMRTFSVECDSRSGKTGLLFACIKPELENISLPLGYSLSWGGEYESSQKAQGGLVGMIPIAFLAMVAILVVLFNGFKQPIMILLCLPLSIIGVTAGLLLFHKSFDFMALLGFLSLAGMLIKNAIVLIDQIDLEIREGKEGFSAIVDSAMSRARPVLMAAMTTVLGMIPLYFDILFSALAVTIMFGLAFATVLTLIIVPVLYSVFFKIPVFKDENVR
ncbi:MULTISPECIES: efflux RND transporter permease subunit [Aminobacterium]|jgi:multidrug efflux pump subunit AcrB|uniref:efflux RND transporter permease subunit n=1 Tax=Aminobacterium TaxID=81466 RepID=UPI00257E6B3C|nr:efflux RND transporter permease subunit [Aminobacterium sp. UBA4987]